MKNKNLHKSSCRFGLPDLKNVRKRNFLPSCFGGPLKFRPLAKNLKKTGAQITNDPLEQLGVSGHLNIRYM